MSLQFIMGNSGSGKSVWLYDQVIREAMEAPQKDFLFLVPEQFTMQTQKEFVNRHPAHSILNIDVLSFQRLAYRVFDDLGMTDFVVLEETGKNLALRRVAAEREKELSVLRRNIKKTGYISEMKSLISELTQYHVTPEDIAGVRDALEQKNALWYKLGDILTLYGGFQDFLEGRYITADEVVDLLTRVAEESQMLRGSVVVLDGYTGFTPVQNRFLEQLLPLAESVRVAVTMDCRVRGMEGAPDIQDLFYLSKKTICSLSRIATDRKVEIAEPVVMEDSLGIRYKNAPALFHLEQQLFRVAPKRYEKPQDEIHIACFFQPKDELHYVAGEIHRLVREQGLRYVDIAVVTGDVPSYAVYAEEIFAQYDIPLFVDQKKNLMFHPMIELVRAILELEIADYSYESVMRVLRSGLSGLETEDIDLMENYLLACGIRGWSGWNKTWVRPTDWLEEAELAELNELRGELVRMFLPLHEVFCDKQSTIRERTTALYGLLVQLQVDKQLEEQRVAFENQGMLANAREHEQVYALVMGLFDKVVELLGADVVPLREYAQILDAGFEASKVGIIPPGYDRVLFGDIERTRLEHIRALFFVGVNDGVIPKHEGSRGILSEFEREKLAMMDLELAPTPREKAFIQKFYLYLNMTKPSERLYLTYSQAGQDGGTMRRSYLIGAVQKLFPGLAVESPDREQFATPASSMQYFLQGLAEAKTGEASEEWKALYAWYLKNESWAKTVAEYVDAAFYTHRDTPLGHELCRELYGKVLEHSVTRLERFASCAFAHFLQYGLQLADRQVSSFEPVDFGNILHSALEQFAHRMEAGGDNWFSLTGERRSQYAKEALDAAIAACRNTALADGERNVYLVRRMERVLDRTVEALGRQITSGSFVPERYEVAFEYVEDLESVNFALGEEEKMRLRGRIDRMDIWEREREVYVKVIDYKSGAASFQLLSIYHGLQLQLVVYLNAAMELMRRKYPDKEIKPAGIFYYHIDDPLIETNRELSEEEVREEIFSKLKLDGYVNSDPEVYREMDHGMQAASQILPIRENRDGSLGKTSRAVSEDQFAALSRYVNQKIAQLGAQMLQGEISVAPYKLGDETPCSYCSYKSVCGFDERIDGYQYRKLERFENNAAEIIKKMEQEGES